jgi:hypothetical protein
MVHSVDCNNVVMDDKKTLSVSSFGGTEPRPSGAVALLDHNVAVLFLLDIVVEDN